MKRIIYKTVWGKILGGEQYDGFEFIDYLAFNKNANNIWVDDEERKIIFIQDESKHYEFFIENIISISEYVEKDIHVWNFYYRIETKNKSYEFSIPAHVGI